MAAFLDQAQSREEEAHWREHFRRCAKCRKAVDELRALLCPEPIEPDDGCLENGKALVGRGCPPSSGLPLTSRGMSFSGFAMHVLNIGGN